MIRDITRETDHRARGRRPMYKCRSIGPDDALRELRDDGGGEFGSAAAPDVCTALWRVGDDSAGGVDELARAFRVRVNREESTSVADGVMPVVLKKVS
jgi:hypothetical protein